MIHLVQPDSPASWAVARRLVEAYAASLDIDLGFQDFQHEMQCMETAPARHGLPATALLWATRLPRPGRGSARPSHEIF
jgi:hypothetical protein